ncbi:ABC transporter substrate-binding protein [Zobellella iuensis]|uniref:ABC transporter substrate-binding protein n=1 Tax=Zobellella iuensis TaxID=2803811 RepID=A0ABS1QPA7_9GAMM|nr:ABC transporter substrate-binding protein [Zobellella iuensis]MBL1376321.1 ABC transporter substrate-binding protein [Zobellella iuensis]
MTKLSDIPSDLSVDGHSRRLFLQQTSAVTAGVLAGMILPGSVLASLAPKTPQRGGHLILGIDNASSSDRIDPAFYFEQYMYHIGRQLFNTLTELDDDGSLKPGLAVEWTPRQQGAQWLFTLRDGVTFHNGKTLAAADVVYSLNHHRKEDSQSAVRGYMSQVTGIEAVDNKQVVITLHSPNVDFPFLLAEVNFAITAAGEDFDKGIGTGPYVLERFEPGVRTLTSRNKDYWKSDRAFVDSVETLAFNDSAARVAALLSGAVHFINRVPHGVVSRLETARSVQVHRNPGSFQVTFPGLADREPFSNPDVRLALKYALDREQLLKSLVNGYGEVANDSPIFPTNRYFTRDLPQHAYDPDKALFHWKKSGHSKEIVLSAAEGASFDGAVSAAEIYRQSAIKAGIPFRVNRVPADGYWSEVWRNHAFCASGWSNRPTADAYLSMVNLSDAPWNESRWQSSALDQLIIAARSELDEERRRQIYHDIQLLYNQEGSTVVPLYIDSVSGSAANVQGHFNVPGEVATRVVERLWLEA